MGVSNFQILTLWISVPLLFYPLCVGGIVLLTWIWISTKTNQQKIQTILNVFMSFILIHGFLIFSIAISRFLFVWRAIPNDEIIRILISLKKSVCFCMCGFSIIFAIIFGFFAFTIFYIASHDMS
jgi:hypothetical protein